MPRIYKPEPTMPKGTDKRVKLSKEEHEYIRTRYKNKEASTRELAREYGVSRRLIQFIIDPSKHEQNLAVRKARGGSMKYYDKDKQKMYMRRHRANLKEALLKNQNDISK